MTVTATLQCTDGCFELDYRAEIAGAPPSDERELLNDVGTPTKLMETGNRCPNCKSEVTVDWGDDADD